MAEKFELRPEEECRGQEELGEIVRLSQERTPARLWSGRSGGAYRTQTQLRLREDHAAARDAVEEEISCASLAAALREGNPLFEARSAAASKREYLLRPDLGRELSVEGREAVRARCGRGATLQAVLGDGLSALALLRQGPPLLLALRERCRNRGWSFGDPFLVRYCRVGILNEIGELLDPTVAVLLIGERPGLATAESLSAYMAFRPRSGHTDAQRNLISNIHTRGVGIEEAADRIVGLAEEMMACGGSGVMVKEGGKELRMEGGGSTGIGREERLGVVDGESQRED